MFLAMTLPFLLVVPSLIQASSVVPRNNDSFLTGFLAALEKKNLTSLAKTYANIAETEAGKPVIDLLKSGSLTLLAPDNSAFDPDHPDIDPDVLRYSTLWGSIDDNFKTTNSSITRRGANVQSHSSAPSGFPRRGASGGSKRSSGLLDQYQVQIIDQFFSTGSRKRWLNDRVVLVDRTVGSAKVVGRFTFKKIIILVIDTVLTLPAKISDILSKPLIDSTPSGFAKFGGGLQQTGLLDEVEDRDKITVFVPIDDAFTGVDELSSDDLTRILKNHFSFGTIVYSPLFPSISKVVAESGKELKLTFVNDVQYISCGQEKARVLRADVITPNGVLHVVDKVLKNNIAIGDLMAQPDTHEAIFQHWKVSNNQLARSIQDYVEACAALEASLATPSRDTISRKIQNKIFADLDPELSSLPLHEQRLQEVRSRLNETRNSSQLLAPINDLPPEILTMIFSLATRSWINEDYQQVGPFNISHTSHLSGVCRLWRHLILQCHTFWSELHLSLTGPLSKAHYERAALWAERSQSALLTLDVQEGRVQEDDEFRVGPPVWNNSDISRAIAFLVPLMPRVRALRIYTGKRSAEKFVRALLSCWVQHGTIGVAKELEIRLNIILPELKLTEISPDARGDGSLNPQALRTFLSSLQAVHMERIVVNWGHQIYSGLTEIHIEFAFQSGWFPSQWDIANLLAANPELQWLILYGLRVQPQGGATPAPVALNCLKALSLETTEAKDIGLVLPLITSTSNAVRVPYSGRRYRIHFGRPIIFHSHQSDDFAPGWRPARLKASYLSFVCPHAPLAHTRTPGV
ncbi:hypothetical protein FRC09_000052 [Ceratobasidium sp. 395]|nr:hypothetical protein FRC09_000052 [Ceratobasidium sp. 395]